MVINSKIDLYNKKLEKNKLDKNDTKELLSNIKDKTKKLNNLLETFLFLSRIENNIEKLSKSKVNFSNYIEIFTKKYIENNETIKNI
jgi:K+-sensing histidine kinase KdpD